MTLFGLLCVLAAAVGAVAGWLLAGRWPRG